MKVIDLMQMYVNKEVLPKKIIIHDHQVFDEDTIWEHKNNTFYCRNYNGDVQFLFEYIVPEMLNDEVEIIEDTPKEEIQVLSRWYPPKEDKKIEKLDYCEENTFMKQKETTYLSQKERLLLDSNFKELGKKINEIIDKITGE